MRREPSREMARPSELRRDAARLRDADSCVSPDVPAFAMAGEREDSSVAGTRETLAGGDEAGESDLDGAGTAAGSSSFLECCSSMLAVGSRKSSGSSA